MQFSQFRIAFGVAAAAVAVTALTSCATLDENECQSVDWRQLGEQNGIEGQAPGYVQRHVDACSRYKLPVDQTAWREGWEVGILRYCTPQNGINVGRKGQSYANSCPPEVAFGFEDAYRVGRAVYDAERSRTDLERQLNGLRDKRDDTEDRDERREIERRIRDTEDRLDDAMRRERYAERDYDRYVYEHQLSGN